MKRLSMLLLPLLFGGCFTCKKAVDGIYKYKGVYGVFYEIEIHSDNTFIFYWSAGLNDGSVTGNIECHGSHLTLNGGTPLEPKIKVEESSQSSTDSIYIKVKSFEDVPLGYAIVMLNNGQAILSDIEGNVVVKKAEVVKKIDVVYIAYDIPQYQVQKYTSNKFILRVDTSLKQKLYFENVKVRIKRKKLIMTGNSFLGSLILKKSK